MAVAAIYYIDGRELSAVSHMAYSQVRQ